MNIPNDVQILLEACDDADARDLRISYEAWVAAVERFEAEKSPESAKAKDDLGKSFQDVRARLDAKYLNTDHILPNLLRGLEWLNENGWKIGKSKLYADRGKGLVRTMPGGKISTRALREYAAEAKLDQDQPDFKGDPDKDRALRASRKRTESQAALAQAQAEKKRLEVNQLRGLLVPRWVVERELADRARAARMYLSPMVSDTADAVLDMLGGTEASAAEIVALVGGDPAKTAELIRWAGSRKSELLAMYKSHLRQALDVWVTGAWYTPEMAEAWSVYEAHRDEVETALMRRLLSEAGGRATKAQEMMEKYQVYERPE